MRIAERPDELGIEYPATNNAVVNGGLVATAVWFGRGDFQKTIELTVHAADFADADWAEMLSKVRRKGSDWPGPSGATLRSTGSL